MLLERGLLGPGVGATGRSDEQTAAGGAGNGEPSSWLARCGEVRDRAEKMFEWRVPSDALLDIGLDHLTLGRTYLLEATLRQETLVESSSPEDLRALLQQATHHLDQSVSLLRQSGNQDDLPRGLLARVALWRVKSEVRDQESGVTTKDYLERANRELSEVEQIAGRSNMLIFQIEAALERCRLSLTVGDKVQARSKLDEAKALVKQTERPYVPHVPTWDGWEPPEYVGLFKEGEMVGYYRRNGEIGELEERID